MAGALAACAVCRPALALPGFEEVKASHRSSETWVLDRHGQPVQRVRTDFAARRGRWLTLAEVSPALLQTVVWTEDKNFYAHAGVDWQAISAAAWANVWNARPGSHAKGASVRGASTITMQLAGLLDASLKPQAGRRNWRQKLAQAQTAYALEQSWNKSQILEAYLNLAPFRGEMVGLDALSQSLFGKQAHALDLRESAIAVALLRAPNARSAQVAQRACRMLGELQSPWGQDCQALALYTEAALRQRHLTAADGYAPHFARYALRQWQQQQRQQTAEQNEQSHAAPAALPTSLDAGLQRFASQALQRTLAELASQNVQDGAVLVLDNATGEVLAWVGSSGRALSRAAEVDAVLALRQPGSTLKPFLYAQAIAERRLTAASLLEDAPARIATAHGLYVPQNYDVRFKGWVSVRQALAGSLNIPAVRTLLMVSPDAFAAQLRQLGLELTQPAGYYGYSLALGGVDVSLLRLTNAYRTLANGGRHGPVHVFAYAFAQAGPDAAGGQPATRVLDEGASFIISDILADRHARAGTFGTENPLATRFWSAVKTGTSKDMRDNWAIGYTRAHTIGVWVGNASGAPMHNVSGTAGAAPVWAAIAHYLHERQPSAAPAPPAGLVRTEVDYRAAPGLRLEAGRSEWFLPGTQQNHFVLRDEQMGEQLGEPLGQLGDANHAQSQPQTQPPARVMRDAARIQQPEDGTVLALDPDIPAPHQLLRISSTHPRVRWYLNGQEVRQARGAGHWFWQPEPGRFTLQLRDRAGKAVLDSATITVRPAGFAPSRP